MSSCCSNDWGKSRWDWWDDCCNKWKDGHKDCDFRKEHDCRNDRDCRKCCVVWDPCRCCWKTVCEDRWWPRCCC